MRAATRERHDRLETRVDAVAAFAALPTYTAFLSRLYGFHAAFEPELIARGEAYPGLMPLPARASALAADLAVLGVDPVSLPRCKALPEIVSPPAAVGAIYVVEGSALGGAVLARLAGRQLGLTPETGAGFLAADADLSDRWRTVVETIDTAAARHGVDGIVAGACATFDAMEAWLCH